MNSEEWYPRHILSRTNWLYRVDALRNHDLREMTDLWVVSEFCLKYLHQLVLWGHVVNQMLITSINETSKGLLHSTFNFIIELIQLVHSEGYCFYLDYLHIAYYPSSNRQHQFPPIMNNHINDFPDNDAKDITGLSVAQLRRLCQQLQILDHFRWRR